MGEPFRIVAIADWRVQNYEDLEFYLEQHPNPDLIVYAGDDLERLEEYGIDRIAKLSKYGLAGVAGNDDWMRLKDIDSESKVYDLHDTPLVISDIGFIGLEGSTIPIGPNEITYSESEVKTHLLGQLRLLEEYTLSTIALVTHTPPSGILDLSRRFGTNNIGSTAVRQLVDTERVGYVICGHSHINGGRMEPVNRTRIFNVASHDDQGAPGRILDLCIQDEPSYKFTETRDFKQAQSELHILQLVADSRVNSLKEVGITSLSDITEANRDRMTSIPGIVDWLVDRWLIQVEAIAGNMLIHKETETTRLLQANNLICYDIETNSEQDRIFMIGCYSFSDDVFFQAFDPDDEKRCLLEFFDFITQYPDSRLIAYSKTKFDENTIIKRSTEHGITEDLTRIKHTIDLGSEIWSMIFGAIPNYRLKDFANGIGYHWSDSDISGLDVGLAYTRYLTDGTKPDWEAFKQYNRDDVIATKEIIEFIREGG